MNGITVTRDYTILRITTTGNFKYINGFQFYHELGRGNFAKVKLCRHLESKTWMAVKIFRKSLVIRKTMSRKETNMMYIQKEIEALSSLNHDNILKLYHIVNEPSSEKLYLFTEYIAGGPVMRPEGDPSPIAEKIARHFFCQLISALSYIHEHGFVHMDVKPENMLVSEHGSIKLIDFGVSVRYDRNQPQTFHLNGTPAFLSPEVISNTAVIGPSIDVWAAGVSLYMMLYGKNPFDAPNIGALYRRITHTPFDQPTSPRDPMAHDLMGKMLEKDASNRISISDIKSHQYFCGHDQTWQVPDEMLLRWFFSIADRLILIIKIFIRMKRMIQRQRAKKERARKRSALLLKNGSSGLLPISRSLSQCSSASQIIDQSSIAASNSLSILKESSEDF